MSRERKFGELAVTFHTEEAAKQFDDFLDSEFTIFYGGEEVGRFKPKDNFDPLKFFGVDSSEGCP